MPPPRTGEKGEVVASDRKRPWVKPSIRTMVMVTTRTGDHLNADEDHIIAAGGPDNFPSGAIARYSPSGSNV